jgi:serine/threonine protein kinase
MCHSNHIVIRNINPDQILVDYSGVAMLSGFNRSIVLHPDDRRRQINPLKSSRGAKDHDEIPTDPFIAPEILLGSSRYTKETDIFSLGCLMAQILLNKPVFSGKDRASKIGAMYKVIGSPGSTNFPDGKRFPHYERTKPEKKYKRGVEKAFRYLLKDSGLDVEGDYPGALDLLEQMLHLDPAERITPTEALQHEFMAKHKDKIKSAEYRKQFVMDWMSLRDSVLLDKDPSKSGGSSGKSPLNGRGLLQKSVGEKETKRKAMLLEATAGDGEDDDDDLYNMDDILDDSKPASKKAKTN